MKNEVKDKIERIIRDANKPLTHEEIRNKVNTSMDIVCETLIELEHELKVRITNKGKYINTEYKFGNVKSIKGNTCFVKTDSNDIFINKINQKDLIHGDYVVVRLDDRNNKEGTIIKIIGHGKQTEIGEVIIKNDELFIKPDDYKKRMLIDIKYNKLGLVEGNKVVFEIGKLVKSNIYNGNVLKIIGHKNDPGIDIITKAIGCDIDLEFSDKSMEEIKDIPNEISDDDLIGREDFRGRETFTIDGDDAKDLDDAISLKVLPNGNYELGVHIADISHYVKENTSLDKEARKRGTSVYLADRVIPMLPHKLSNGICSLHPNVDRLTKSCIMEINKTGKVVNYQICNSVINSKKRMTYQKVNKLLQGYNVSTYEKHEKTLLNMNALANILKEKRKRDGSINFATKEIKIIVDENGKTSNVLNKERLGSENLIEEFMLIANTTIAEHVTYLDLPFLYRVHEEPDIEKIEEFIKFIKIMNQKIAHLPKQIYAKTIQKILEELKSSPEYEIYANLLLRSMKKAVYQVDNIGHFGLSMKNYTHFTAPIRRYPDLTVHRQLDKYTNKKFYEKNLNVDKIVNNLIEIANHSSLKEQNAIKCEREVNKMKMAEFMLDHIGEEYNGKITGTSEKGIFVDIYNGIEGLIKIEDLDHATYDAERYAIYVNNERYRLGDKLDVIVDTVNKEYGFINLSINKEKNKVKTYK